MTTSPSRRLTLAGFQKPAYVDFKTTTMEPSTATVVLDCPPGGRAAVVEVAKTPPGVTAVFEGESATATVKPGEFAVCVLTLSLIHI